MANNFSDDADCVALYKFENGALTTDTIGSNTLSVGSGSPVADLGDFKEGSASCDFEFADDDSFSITDANLDAGFPLKNGDGVGDISICFWVKFESLNTGGTYEYVLDKSYNSRASIRIRVSDSNGKIALATGWGGGLAFQEFSYGTGCTTGIWYHVGATFNNTTKGYRLRIWDDNASSILGSELTGTAGNNINIEDAPLTIGSFFDFNQFLDGKLDELVIFKDVLSAAEIDQIRAGTYTTATVLGLAGTVNGVSSVTGAIGANPVIVSDLAGIVTGVSSVTGDLSVVSSVLSLAGLVAGVSSVTGELTFKHLLSTFPATRPDDYDPDLVFDEDTGQWTSDADLLTRDGSRHKTQLVAVGKDLIYYEVID